MALTRLQLRDRVLGRRFPVQTQGTNALEWLEIAYQDVWVAADWTFTRVMLEDLAVASDTPAMPATFGDALSLYDPSGCKLERLSQEDFEAWKVSPFTSGTPYVYTVVDRQIKLAPSPSGAMTFKLSYRRRVVHKNANGSTGNGFMDADGDLPYWDDHHRILVPRAVAIGLQEINDPTWEDPQAEYERQLSRMKDDYEYVRPQTQWPEYRPGC